MRFLSILFIVLILMFSAACGQSWNKKKCAVALTYDDALNVHLDNVIPSLDSAGLKGTFYLTASFPSCKNRMKEWRKAAASGHELGNHTLYHPCLGSKPGREWVKGERDLANYSLKRMTDEIRMTNTFLTALDGKTTRSFAYPCGDRQVGDGVSYVDAIKTDFVAARGTVGKVMQLGDVDLFNVNSYVVNRQTGDELIAIAKKAMEEGGFVVFLFHGVGGEHDIDVSLGAHAQLIHFLKENEKDIWVAPFVEISQHISRNQ